MITEYDLINDGFERDEDGVFHKEVNRRYIKCYKNPKGGGYWVGEIDPIGESASNDKIATIEQLEDFVKATCLSSVKNSRVEVVKPKL